MKGREQYITTHRSRPPNRASSYRLSKLCVILVIFGCVSVRFTENGQALKLSDGMWGPVSGLGTYNLYFTDPKAGKVGFFGVVEENGYPAIIAPRLKVENRLITEIETIVARKAHDDWVNPEALVHRPIFSETLTPSERRSR